MAYKSMESHIRNIMLETRKVEMQKAIDARQKRVAAQTPKKDEVEKK